MSSRSRSQKCSGSTIVANDPQDRKGELKRIGGSQSDSWNNVLINQAAAALWAKNSTSDEHSRQLTATVSALAGIGPRDEIESMIAAQLIAAHNAAMECFRRAMIGEQSFEGRRENLLQANKLSRTYTTLVEALNRYRGKGQQKVTVEHVHVHAGGQAVVGNIENPGGGGKSIDVERPHAANSDGPQPTMRGAHEIRDVVPVARDGERAVPDARRSVRRASKG